MRYPEALENEETIVVGKSKPSDWTTNVDPQYFSSDVKIDGESVNSDE